MDYTDTQQWTDQSLAEDARSAAAYRLRTSTVYTLPAVPNAAPISIDASTAPAEQPINIDTNNSYNTPLAPDIAAQRAFKYKFGMPQLPQSFDDLYNSLVGGEDKNVRDQAASIEDQAKQAEYQSKVAGAMSNPEALQKLMSVRLKPTDPNSVFESNYSRQFMRGIWQAQANMPGTFLDAAQDVLPDYMQAGADLTAKREYLMKKAQDLHSEQQDQTWPGFLFDAAKFLVPLYPDVKMRGLVPGTGAFDGGLLGHNLESQAAGLYPLPFDQFKDLVDKNIASLRGTGYANPMIALNWVTAMAGQSTTDLTLNNAMNVIDIATAAGGIAKLPTLPGRVARAVEVAEASKNLVKDMVKASARPEVSRATIAEAAGDVKEAAIQRTLSKLQQNIKGRAFHDVAQDGLESLPSALRADREAAVSDLGSFSRDFGLRLESQADRTIGATMQGLTDAQKVQMLPEEALRNIASQIREEEYAGMKGGHFNVDIKYIPATNTYEVQHFVGKPRGELFRTVQEAKQFATANGLTEMQARPNLRGAGYYLSLQKPLDYYSKIARDSTIDADLWKSPTSIVDKFTPLSWIRTAEDTLAEAQKQNRKVATFTPAVLYKLLKPDWDIVSGLNKYLGSDRVLNQATGQFERIGNRRVLNEWNRITKFARDADDPATGEKGMFFNTVGELQNAYLTHLERMPTTREAEAYFAWKRLNEVDRVLRNVAVKRNLDRVGAQQFSFSVRRGQGTETIPPFNGVYRDKIPRTEDTILYMGKNGDEAIYKADTIPPNIYKKWNEARTAGKNHVIEIYDPEQRPMADFSKMAENRKVRYVIVDDYKATPTNWEQVPRRGGGHFIVDADHYTKQANMRSETIGDKTWWHYEGDKVVSPHINRAEAQKFASIVNRVRELIRDGKMAEAEQAAKSIGEDWSTVRGKFMATKDPETGKITLPQFNLREPVVVVPKDKTIASISNELEKRYPEGTFRDGTKQGSLARIFQVQFTGERDMEGLLSYRDRGTKANPLFAAEPTTLLDPIPALQRGLNKIVNSTWMDDYKQFAVRQWLQQAKPFIDAKESEIDHAPFWWFNNPKWRYGVNALSKENAAGGVDPGWLKLKEEQFKINQLIGTPSSLDTFIHAGTQLLADQMYKGLGPTGLKITPPWLLDKLRDPFSFARAMTFHFKLGFFNIPQIFVQNQTFTNIFGVAGARYAAPGTYGALLHQWSRFNHSPEIMAHLDEMATKLPGRSKWKLGQWAEAHEEMLKSGFNTVAGEYIVRDNLMDKGLVTGGGQKFLNWGTIFFREGEQNVRYGAWYTAYKEFRDIKPNGRLTNEDRAWVLNRADLLNMNMSSASKSALHTGVFSMPSQFLAYQIRTAELFLGKRLGETVGERSLVRARMMFYNAMLYGLPTSLGVTGFPVGDYVRKWALENGYVAGDNWWKTLATEGIPSAIGAMLTGSYQNFGNRYGSQGFELLREALRSDKTVWDLLTGATGSTMANFIGNLDPFWRYFYSKVGGGEPFTLKADHFVQPLKEVSSINAGARWWAAVNTGNWYSKKGILLEGGSPQDQVSPLRASIQTLLGTQSQASDDVQAMLEGMHDTTEITKKAEDKFLIEFRRMAKAASSNNPEAANEFFNNGLAYLTAYGYPPEKIGQLLAKANKEYEPLVKKIPEEFYLKHMNTKNFIMGVPVEAKAQQIRQEAYKRMQQLRYNNN